MRARIARAAPYAVALTAAGALYWVAMHIDFQARPGALGPDVWPKAILGAAIAVCVWQIAAALFSRREARAVPGLLAGLGSAVAPEQAPEAATVAPRRHPVRVTLGMAATALYVLLVTPLGFFLATSAYLMLFLALAGYPRRGVAALVSVLGTLVLMFVFMKLVYVSLPIGQGVFAPVMLFLMNVMAIR